MTGPTATDNDVKAGEKNFQSWEAAVRWLRSQLDQQDLVRAAYYDDPLAEAAERYRNSEEWRCIRGLLAGRSGVALDVGAGRGIASYALAREGFSVLALEPDPSDLVGSGAIRALARDSAQDITVVEDFSERLPFADESFDVVFARAVLHHTRDLRTACAEFRRVLKRGGLFLAVREHVISRQEDLPAFLASHPLHHLYGGENAYLLRDYRAALAGAGFEIEEVLSPLGSPVNFSPQTRTSLRQEIAARVSRVAAIQGVVNALLRPQAMFAAAMWLLDKVDSRPGRLYSFVCTKPGAR